MWQLTCLQLSESDSQDRKSSASVTVSTVVSVATPSPVSSTSQASQTLPTTPQPTQPPSASPQPGIETADSKAASPAPENKESTEFVPLFIDHMIESYYLSSY